MTQPTLHFHHYANSPFAEKIRLIFGYKQLHWHSVNQPAIMPKADLQTLTGGYRRIPVLQVGADIVCDTALICDVLDAIAPAPAWVPPTAKGAARIVAQWADSQLFAAAMAYNFSPAGAAHFFKDTPPEGAKAFADDRKAMRGGAPRMSSGDATAAYRSYLRRIARMLAPHDGVANDFLFGSAPSVADFACYHSLWFTQTRVTPLAVIFDSTPEIAPWMDRMAAIGHGTVHASSASESIAAARMDTATTGLFGIKNGQTEAFVNDHGIALGSKVQINAESFGLESTVGTLIASTRTRVSIEHPLLGSDGNVRVHFPKVGFVIRSLD